MSGGNKWTPGPWVADGFFVSSNSGGAVGHDIVSACGTIERPDSETEANAQLIAAAPELFKELERLVDAFESEIRSSYEGTSSLEVRLSETGAARAALAKARGESQ